MYRTLLAVTLTSMVALSYAADNQGASGETNTATPFSSPASTSVRATKHRTAKPPARSVRKSKVPSKTGASHAAAPRAPDLLDVLETPEVSASNNSDFVLASDDIPANGTIPASFESDSFGCTGENSSPELHWSGAPADTKSFAVTVYDPDAPTGSGWWHWVVYDLPADTDRLDPGVGSLNSSMLPGNAMQVNSDYGVAAWGGTCPPPGDKAHRYIFTVHALSVEQLDLPSNATSAMAGFMIRANTIATASFTAKYGRRK